MPADLEDLAVFLRQLADDEPLLFIGLGSNLLVRDGGFPGTVILMHAATRRPELREGKVYADAGVASPKVARFAALHDLAGAEFLAGVPGTVGGALAMNAGCYGGETWDVVERVVTIDRRRQVARARAGVRHRLPALRAEGAGRGMVRRRLVPPPARRRPGLAHRDEGSPAAAHRHAAAVAAECRQRVPQPAQRSRRAADRGLRPEGLRARRRARLGEARELHRQSEGAARAPTSNG